MSSSTFKSDEIKHQVFFERYKTGQANRVKDLIEKANERIAKKVRQTKEIATKKRYQKIMSALKEVAKSLKVEIENEAELDEIINYELKKQRKILGAMENGADFILPTTEQVKTAALFKPIVKGETYQTYLEGIESGLVNLWDSYLRTGYLTGEPTANIVRAVVGTAGKNAALADAGAMATFEKSVMLNTRTVIQAVANEARTQVFKKNAKYIKNGYEYLATLDSRTCLICGADDGKRFVRIEDAPVIPRHYNCRCIVIPYVEDEEGGRASEGGVVSAKTTFSSWLAGQSESVQREVLGVTRYKMYKAGEKITSFVGNDGRVLTLDELEKME